jgi:hypothetical protein
MAIRCSSTGDASSVGGRIAHSSVVQAPNLKCALCDATEPDATLVEIRSRGPPARRDDSKPSSNAPRANEQGDTLNLQRSDKHKREPERESAADAAIAEAQEATARRHARELSVKEERRQPTIAGNLAKFNSLPKTPDRPTLAQRVAPKTNVVVGPFVQFARPIPPLKQPN